MKKIGVRFKNLKAREVHKCPTCGKRKTGLRRKRMFKAVALICSVWIADGRAKQECFTHMFDWEFQTRKECQLRLLRYRAKEKPAYHNIILDECIKKS